MDLAPYLTEHCSITGLACMTLCAVLFFAYITILRDRYVALMAQLANHQLFFEDEKQLLINYIKSKKSPPELRKLFGNNAFNPMRATLAFTYMFSTGNYKRHHAKRLLNAVGFTKNLNMLVEACLESTTDPWDYVALNGILSAPGESDGFKQLFDDLLTPDTHKKIKQWKAPAST